MKILAHNENNHEYYIEGLGQCAAYCLKQAPKYAALALLAIPVIISNGIRALRQSESKLAKKTA